MSSVFFWQTLSNSFFEWSPARFQNPLIIAALVMAFLGFILTLASPKIATAALKNREFEGGDEGKENAERALSLIIKLVGAAVVIAFGLVIVFVG